jgi:hypothetical protein
MSERKGRQRIAHNSSKPLVTLPVTIGLTLVGYFVIASRGFEALTPEKASLGLFDDAMPAVHVLFEQLFRARSRKPPSARSI